MGPGDLERSPGLVCPSCQEERPDWAVQLDRCEACGATRLSAMLGQVVCRACGHVRGSRSSRYGRALSSEVEHSPYKRAVEGSSPSAPTLGRRSGGLRWPIACSNALASRINVRSVHGLPMNEIPSGRSNANPAGTVTFG